MNRRARHLAATAVLVASVGACQGSPRYDLVLKGGTVVDGTGAPGVVADVAVSGDRIAAVAPDIPTAHLARGQDVSGRVVAPGEVGRRAEIRVQANHLKVVLEDGVMTDALPGVFLERGRADGGQLRARPP